MPKTRVVYDECPKCKGRISLYELAGKEKIIGLCWSDGFWFMHPADMDDMAKTISQNPILILDLIEEKILKPVH